MDPVGPVPGSVHSFNRYTYANNNPYKYVDPDGRYSVLIPSGHPEVPPQVAWLPGPPRPTVARSSSMLDFFSDVNWLREMEALPVGGPALKFGIGMSALAGTLKISKGFSKSVDDILALYDNNAIHHLFGRGGEAPSKLLNMYGSPEKALRALQQSAQSSYDHKRYLHLQ